MSILFDATVAVAEESGVTFAQFVMLTPFPGTTDFAVWEKSMASDPTRIGGTPLTRHWLIPQAERPKVYTLLGDVGGRYPPGHPRRL